MAYGGFQAIIDEERIVPVVPLKIVEPTNDHQLVIMSSVSGEEQPQVKNKRSKILPQNVPARETRSKTVRSSANTRSKSKI